MNLILDKLENLQSLDQISTRYSVFEEGQVLTSGQLNSLTEYLNDQIRLTRVGLLGVGIAGGLRVSLDGDRVLLTRGAGVTTDGDLVWFPNDGLFDRYKPYAETAPSYEPFKTADGRIPLKELVLTGEPDPLAAPLADFEGDLNAMVAVLLMESYLKDDDLCSGTDCDNLGRDSINVVKLLLTDRASAGQLAESLKTPDHAARQLDEIVAARPPLSTANNTDGLIAMYQTTCENLHGKLTTALAKIIPACSPLLDDLFPSDPAPAWIAKLETIKASAFKSEAIQYYYDFLKDLAETQNAFRGLMFGVTAVRCPEVGAFPKHLLLGNLDAAPDSTVNRTGFYPSPIAGEMAERWSHARFLIRKLATLIETFQLPISGPIFFPVRGFEERILAPGTIVPIIPLPMTVPIRITPSQGEDRSLEERAIPFYYRFDSQSTSPIHRSWSFELERRGMSAWNYSYLADQYGAQGGAADPFAYQIGRFSFFRIEGHLGADVATVKEVLRGQIESNNLPIAVRSILLGTDKTLIVRDPEIAYTDLHHIHDLLRSEAVQQLEDTERFSAAFKQQVDQAVSAGTVKNESTDGPAIREIATQKNASVVAKAAVAKAKLNRRFSDFAKDASWKADVTDLMQASGEFKSDLGKIVKTEFATPFDTVISSAPLQWIDKLGDIIQIRNEALAENLLFGNFLREHPGLEHAAGVVRGGTFVLAYDSAGRVIADFMLPYRWAEAVEAEPATTLTPRPSIKPDFVVDSGIKIQPSRETFVEAFVTPKLTGLETRLKPTIDLQKDVFQVFKDSVSMMTNVATRPSTSVTPIQSALPVTDEFLRLQLQEDQIKADQLEYLRAKTLEPGADTVALAGQIREAELALAQSIGATTNYVATSGMDVSTGSEGFTAIKTVSSYTTKLSDQEAVTAANTQLSLARESTVNPELKTMITVVLREEA